MPSSIPNIIHFIWFGPFPKTPVGEKFKDNIARWKLLNKAYDVRLWTSKETMTEAEYVELKTFCSQSDVNLIDISALPPDTPNTDLIGRLLKIEGIGKARFAAASDVLRCSLLETLGGHYFDCDITPKEALIERKFENIDSYQLVPENRRAAPCYYYCLMGARKGSELYIATNKVNGILANQIIDVLTSLGSSIRPQYDIPIVTGFVLTLVSKKLFGKTDSDIVDWDDIDDDITNPKKPVCNAYSSNPYATGTAPDEIVSGPLKGIATVEFARSYNDGNPQGRDRRASEAIEPFEQLLRDTIQTAVLSPDVEPARVSRLASDTPNENIVFSRSRKGELAVKFSTQQLAFRFQEMMGCPRTLPNDQYFQNQKCGIIEESDPTVIFFPGYIAKNGEFSAVFFTEAMRNKFITLLNLKSDPKAYTSRDKVLYFLNRVFFKVGGSISIPCPDRLKAAVNDLLLYRTGDDQLAIKFPTEQSALNFQKMLGCPVKHLGSEFFKAQECGVIYPAKPTVIYFPGYRARKRDEFSVVFPTGEMCEIFVSLLLSKDSGHSPLAYEVKDKELRLFDSAFFEAPEARSNILIPFPESLKSPVAHAGPKT